jgi:hypothetical protein
MLKIEANTERVRLRLDNLPEEVRAALIAATTLSAAELKADAKGKASGDVLQVRTGKFVRSIRSSVRKRRNSVIGKVWSRRAQARIFEFGGQTKAHDIRPKKRDVLAFMSTSQQLFRRAVHHPGARIAKHSTIRAAFDEMRGQIERSMIEAVLGAARRW